jgi:hypothetical protein
MTRLWTLRCLQCHHKKLVSDKSLPGPCRIGCSFPPAGTCLVSSSSKEEPNRAPLIVSSSSAEEKNRETITVRISSCLVLLPRLRIGANYEIAVESFAKTLTESAFALSMYPRPTPVIHLVWRSQSVWIASRTECHARSDEGKCRRVKGK